MTVVKYLARTPLTAIAYAAVLYFIAVFIPYSQEYSEFLLEFHMPLNGYLFMIAYGLYVSVVLAVIFYSAKHQGFKLMLLLLAPVLFTQCVVPMLQQVFYGETTGVMTSSDSVMEFMRSAGALIFIMLLAALLFKRPLKDGEGEKPKPKKPQRKGKQPEPTGVTYKIKRLDLAIKMLVLPVVYCVLYFLIWYFVLWQFEAARVYYSGEPELRSFVTEMVYMLLDNSQLVPLACIKGLLLALCMIPLLKELEANRVLFITMTIALYLGAGIHMLIPSPVMPEGVRTAHLLELSVVSLLYGGLAGFLMHISLLRRVPQQVVAAGAKTAKGAAKAAGAVAEAGAAEEENPKKGRFGNKK